MLQSFVFHIDYLWTKINSIPAEILCVSLNKKMSKNVIKWQFATSVSQGCKEKHMYILIILKMLRVKKKGIGDLYLLTLNKISQVEWVH